MCLNLFFFFLSDPGVGKTNLITRYVEKTFTEYHTTLGVDFVRKSLSFLFTAQFPIRTSDILRDYAWSMLIGRGLSFK